MSTPAQTQHPPAGHGTAEVVHAQQQLNWGWILGVGVGSMVIFALATVFDAHPEHHPRRDAARRPAPLPSRWTSTRWAS
jgi:hypothetical protein